MDRSRDRVRPLTGPAGGAGPTVDLHVHSTASDGALAPADVIAAAARAGLAAVALTDHDTLAGVPAAVAAGAEHGIRVVSGCEFSVVAPWGEMHVLGYCLPPDWAPLEEFLSLCRADRKRRGQEIVRRLQDLGVVITEEAVLLEADGGAIGRPHVARALLRAGVVRTVQEAFDRYLGWGRPGFVGKRLPAFGAVAELVHRAGGVVSLAHIRDRGNRQLLAGLKAEGLDAVEVHHPMHDHDARARLAGLARDLGLLCTGGSDWHGEDQPLRPESWLGGQGVPAAWLEALEAARPVDAEVRG